jgi:riboflavin-specific deaminase-like protein
MAENDRPYVVLSCAMSADGYIDDATDERLLLSNAADFERVDRERAKSDAILVGANTIRRDNPRLLVRSQELRTSRVNAGLPSSPAKVTLTTTGSLDPASKFFTEGGRDVARLVYHPSGITLPDLQDLASVETVALDSLSLAAVLANLRERGIGRVLAEGGTSIHTQMLAEDLADELHLVVAPFFVGDGSAARFVGEAAFPFDGRRRMVLDGVTQIGDVALLRYIMRADSAAAA